MSLADRINGEEFGPISVDYFYGRRVERVEPGDGSEGMPTWSIFFEGGGIIHNYESEVPTPLAIVGAALTRQILDGKNRVTRLQFGLEEVTLNPMKYSMVDPNYTQGKEVFPQTSHANPLPAPPPPDPSPERVADAPDPEWTVEVEGSEPDKVAEYERLVESGLSDGEARATVWPDGT